MFSQLNLASKCREICNTGIWDEVFLDMGNYHRLIYWSVTMRCTLEFSEFLKIKLAYSPYAIGVTLAKLPKLFLILTYIIGQL